MHANEDICKNGKLVVLAAPPAWSAKSSNMALSYKQCPCISSMLYHPVPHCYRDTNEEITVHTLDCSRCTSM